jgi:hypothetical protein
MVRLTQATIGGVVDIIIDCGIGRSVGKEGEGGGMQRGIHGMARIEFERFSRNMCIC